MSMRSRLRNGIDVNDKPATPKGTIVNTSNNVVSEPQTAIQHTPKIKGIGSVAPAELAKQGWLKMEDVKGVALLFMSCEFRMMPPNDYNRNDHEIAIAKVRRLDNQEVVDVATSAWIPFRQLKALEHEHGAYPFTGVFIRNPENKNSAWEIVDLPEGMEVDNPDIPF